MSSYDAINRLLGCTENGADNVLRSTLYYYDLNSNITLLDRANGTRCVKTYDALNRTSTIIEEDNMFNLISSFDYKSPVAPYSSGYDNVGNVMKITENYSYSGVYDREVINSYDHTNRLIDESKTILNAPPTQNVDRIVQSTYAYDKANNRIQKTDFSLLNISTPTVSDYTYGSGGNGFNSNQLQTYVKSGSPAVSVSYTYDVNGNRSTRSKGSNTDTYHYDYNNRLVQLDYNTDSDSDKNGTYNYEYDHRTRRVLRDESAANGDNTRVVFSDGLSVQEHDQLGTGNWDLTAPAVEYVRGSSYGGGIGGVLYTVRNGLPTFYDL